MTSDPGPRVNRILIESLAPGSLSPAELRPPEWEALWISARDHCLIPYLHQHWTDSGFLATLPAAITERFTTARTKNAERNRRLMLALGELSTALQKEGIPILISKGLPLAQAYYGDLGLRVMYDLDLLIKPHDSQAAFEVLRRNGYVPFFPHHRSNLPTPLLWRPKEYEWDPERVFDPEGPCFVELHAAPFESRWHGFRLAGSLDLWEGSWLQLISGVPLRVPPHERLLVHLAVHYACNVLESNARLMHLLDIVLLLRRCGTAIDWDGVMQDIRKCNAATFCFLALELARRAGGCSIPNQVWSNLHKATPRRIVEWLDLHGVESAVSMNLRHRERSLIYFLHWNMAVGWAEKSNVLTHSFRAPWREAAGPGRLKSITRRMIQRLYYLSHNPRAEGGS